MAADDAFGESWWRTAATRDAFRRLAVTPPL